MLMTERKERIVTPRRMEGLYIPIWSNIVGVKIHYDCGECGYSQNARVPIKDYPVVECRHCRTLNRLPLETTTIGEMYS